MVLIFSHVERSLMRACNISGEAGVLWPAGLEKFSTLLIGGYLCPPRSTSAPSRNVSNSGGAGTQNLFLKINNTPFPRLLRVSLLITSFIYSISIRLFISGSLIVNHNMMKLFSIAAIVLTVPLVRAQVPSGYPSCAVNCVNTTCPMEDLDCVCTNVTMIVGCIGPNCSAADASAAAPFLGFCCMFVENDS